MRKFLLLSALAAVVQFSSAQSAAKPQLLGNPRIQQNMHEERSVVLLPQGHNTTVHHSNTANKNKGSKNEKSLPNGTALNSQKIGTAGNLLSIINHNVNQLYVNGPLGLVSFIHRTDPTVNPTANIAEYSFDFSKDSGTTWQSNIGPITNAPNIDNNGTDPHGRFPQALIYNPGGNINPDSAYLIYSGTWHNAPVNATTGSWFGQMRGRGQFTGDSSTFNVHIDTINNGMTNVAAGLCAGVPGTFWTVNQDYTGDFSTTTNAITRGIIVEKGVYNPSTRDIDWTAHEIYQQFDSFTANSIIETDATSFDIAFDPTGQYGWISCIGDISSNPADSVNHPIFWKTTDGGSTWNGPIQIQLDSLPGVVDALNKVTIYPPASGAGIGATTSGVPTTAFESKLAVDYQGNPHFFTTVGNGSGYSIQSGAGYTAYDITLNPANSCIQTWNGWAAIFVDSIQTLRGNTTADATPLTEDNRPLVSRTADGKKVFFFWSASDVNFVGADDNQYPNLFVRGFDLEHSTSTPPINLTQGDLNWGGPTTAFPNGGSIQGGSLQGAFYPTVSPIALSTAAGFNIPLVLTQVDYTLSTNQSGNPAQFWYINNLTLTPFDFTNGISATLTPNGNDTVYVVLGNSYTDAGATITYLDTACTHSGVLHVVTNSSGLNLGTPGTYYVYYAAEDGSANIYATGSRVVIVVSKPVANFSYQLLAGNNVQFTDLSLYNPTSWAWTFGDGGTDPTQNPAHQYAVSGVYNVCLTATNAYGSSTQYCTSVGVTGVNNVDFASGISMFPNPTSGKVSITLSGNVLPEFTVSVYNVLGEEVIGTTEYKAGTTNVELNAANLSNGVYLVKVQSTQGSSVKRLTVSHK